MNLLSLFSPLLYVQISPERLRVRDVKAGAEIVEPPRLAIEHGAKPRIVGVGSEAAMSTAGSVEVVNPFAHPRSLVSDFTVAEQLLKAFIRRLRPNSLVRMAPRVVMHPLGSPEGGFTQVEIRAFHEMALGAGASQVVVREGRPLTDQELLAGDFSAGGRVLVTVRSNMSVDSDTKRQGAARRRWKFCTSRRLAVWCRSPLR
jgi:rod shape-determining protein MreB